MKKLRKLLEKRWAANTFALCAAVFLYLILTHMSPILVWFRSLWRLLSPVVIGLVLAYIIDPAAKFMEAHVLRFIRKDTSRRTVAVLIAILLALLIVALFLLMVIPAFFTNMGVLVNNVDVYYENIKLFLEKINASDLGVTLDLDSIITNAEKYLKSVFANLASNMSSVLSKASSIGSSLFNGLIGFILMIYFLMGKRGLLRGVDTLRRTALPPAKYRTHTTFLQQCNEIFVQYIGCNLLDALIIGTANALFMLICGLPYIPLISVVVGVTNLLPTFGPFVGAAVGAFILVLNKPVYALWFLIFTVILQLIDGYVLKPRLFSSSFGLPAVWSLVSIILGGKLFGVIGIFLAIPVVAVLASMYHDRFLPWLARRRGERHPSPPPAASENESVGETPTDPS